MERTKKAATQPKLPSSPGWWCRPATSATLAEAGGLQFKACFRKFSKAVSRTNQYQQISRDLAWQVREGVTPPPAPQHTQNPTKSSLKVTGFCHIYHSPSF